MSSPTLPPNVVPPDSVLAVVVTYNPSHDLGSNLRAVRSQVDALLVVDNGSSNRPWIEALCAEVGASFTDNGRNEGIARALNQGVAHARAGGFRWIATFDQDSSPPVAMVPQLLALVHDYDEPEDVAVVAPSYRDRNLEAEQRNDTYVIAETPRWRRMRTLITSGSVIRVEAFASVGHFDERLFIDFVDHDHCLRLRRAGWHLLQSTELVLGHAIGRQSTHRLLGRTVHCTNHSAVRRYYFTRNQLEFYRRYARDEPSWALRGVLNLGITALLVVLFEQDKGTKIAAMARGLRDFALRRFGPAGATRRS